MIHTTRNSVSRIVLACRRSNQQREPHARRRGNVLVLAALLLTFVFSMVAFVVDLGYIVHVDTEMQRTADACALAAIAVMPDQQAALTVAQAVATDNAHVEGPALAQSDVIFGSWDRDTATFTPDSAGANAVKIILRRTEANGNPLRLFFAKLIDHDTADVWVESIAMYDNSLCGPLIGIEWIDVPGDSSTDSYRTADGPYWNQPRGHDGNLCSDGWINVEGSPIVRGDANPGRDHDTTISGSAIVTGNTSPRLRPLNLPPVDDSEIAANNDNSILPGVTRGNNTVPMPDANGDFILDGGRTYDMPPGHFYFRDLALTGQSILNISDETVIYLYGNLDTSGGDVINNTQIPGNLQIYMTGGTARVAGASDFYGTIYAPNTALELTGGAQWYGAFVGQTLSLSGTGDIHYDETLDFSSEIPLPNRIALVK